MKKIILAVVVCVVISCSNAQQTEFSKEALASALATPNATEITFEKSLEKHKGKRKYAALELGISERTLYRKIKEFQLGE